MFGTAYSTILYLLSEVIAFTPHIASKWYVIHSFHFIHYGGVIVIMKEIVCFSTWHCYPWSI